MEGYSAYVLAAYAVSLIALAGLFLHALFAWRRARKTPRPDRHGG